MAIRHGQLDYVLRQTVKIIAGVKPRQGLDATDRMLSHELRKTVREYARKKIGNDVTALTLLDALLSRARRATEKRNETLHRIYAYNRHGDPVVKDDEHNWIAPPTTADLDAIAEELAQITADLNEARMNGFLWKALRPLKSPDKTESAAGASEEVKAAPPAEASAETTALTVEVPSETKTGG